MSTCQIEVLEFGQEMERPWLQGDAETRPDRGGCLCDCTCPCQNTASDSTTDKYDSMA